MALNMKSAARKMLSFVVEVPAEEQEAPYTEEAQTAFAGDDEAYKDFLQKDAANNKRFLDTIAPPPAPEPEKPVEPEEPIVTEDGMVNFPALYKEAEVPTVPFTAEQVREMLNEFPPETPMALRQKMVQTSIKALGSSLGTSPDQIAGDATTKAIAINEFIRENSELTAQFVNAAEADIARQEAKIAERKASIERAKQRYDAVTKQCTGEVERMQEVAGFFTASGLASAAPALTIWKTGT